MMTNTMVGTPSNHASKYLPICLSLEELQITDLLTDRPPFSKMSGVFTASEDSTKIRVEGSNVWSNRVKQIKQSHK
jgi:hypothetical protein